MTTANTRCAHAEATALVANLLPRASDGDPRAWEEIIRLYSRVVRATVRSYRLQDNDTLDAVQMTWLRLAENVHHVQSPERLSGWLATTARRECQRILRDRARLTTHPLDPDAVIDPSIGPEQHVIDRDIAQTLRHLVAELAPRKRDLLQALFTDNPRPYTDIARTTGIPISSIGPTRARALQQLRALSTEHGLGAQPDH